MIWGIIFDVVLWIAAVTLIIIGAVTPDFTIFLLGLLCLVLAVVLGCILIGGESGAGSAFDSISDFDFND